MRGKGLRVACDGVERGRMELDTEREVSERERTKAHPAVRRARGAENRTEAGCGVGVGNLALTAEVSGTMKNFLWSAGGHGAGGLALDCEWEGWGVCWNGGLWVAVHGGVKWS